MTHKTDGASSRVPPQPLFILSLLTALLALAATAGGLFWPQPGEPFSFTTLRGDEIEITGRGLYAYDWAFRAPILRGTDAVMLFVGVPLQKVLDKADRTLPQPTLILVGEHDLPVIRRHAKDWHARRPQTELHVIPAAGHCANMDNPQAFNAVLRQFLQRHP